MATKQTNKLQTKQNVSLQKYHTFGIDVKTKELVEVYTLEELILALKTEKEIPIMILGGGSNVLFTKNFEGRIIKILLKGIEKIDENKNFVWLKVGAGEVWQDLVQYCVHKNYGGIENLSLIPGTVGAAPMQNIGAYGVEIKEVLESLEALHRESLDIHIFKNEECCFGYRESIFKNIVKERYVITNITLKLNKTPHQLNISYGSIQNTLEQMQVKDLSIKAVSDAVVHIRQSKLPNPAEIGNAGSFFKNPIIQKTHFNRLKKEFSDIVGYPIADNTIKVPAGWLIEKAGWKGKRFGEVGVHNKQALVLVNYGKGKGGEIFELAKKIQASVKEIFDIDINPEINIV